MNERIKTMWEESTGSVWPSPGKFTAGEYDTHLVKFTELIIQKCITQIALIGVSNFENEDIMWAVETSIASIETHFGVEE